MRLPSASGLACIAVFAGTGACTHREPGWLDPRPAPELDGVAVRTGRPFRLQDERGKVVLLTFGYTSCADVCPATLATVERIYGALGAESRDLEFLYVTVDPDRDAPAAMRHFVGSVDPRFEGLYVDRGSLDSILAGYQVTARKRVPSPWQYEQRDAAPGDAYSMDHTSGLWGVDRRGRLRFRYDHDAADAKLIAATRRLVEER